MTEAKEYMDTGETKKGVCPYCLGEIENGYCPKCGQVMRVAAPAAQKSSVQAASINSTPQAEESAEWSQNKIANRLRNWSIVTIIVGISVAFFWLFGDVISNGGLDDVDWGAILIELGSTLAAGTLLLGFAEVIRLLDIISRK